MFCRQLKRITTRCTEWLPRQAGWQFGRHGRAALGERIVGLHRNGWPTQHSAGSHPGEGPVTVVFRRCRRSHGRLPDSAGLFLIAAASGDVGGPLFWPILCVPLAIVGFVVGLVVHETVKGGKK